MACSSNDKAVDPVGAAAGANTGPPAGDPAHTRGGRAKPGVPGPGANAELGPGAGAGNQAFPRGRDGTSSECGGRGGGVTVVGAGAGDAVALAWGWGGGRVMFWVTGGRGGYEVGCIALTRGEGRGRRNNDMIDKSLTRAGMPMQTAEGVGVGEPALALALLMLLPAAEGEVAFRDGEREMTANGERAVVLARAGEGVDGEVGVGVGEGVEARVILGLGLGLGLLTVVGGGLGAVVDIGLGAVVGVALGTVVGVGWGLLLGGYGRGYGGLGVANGVGLSVAAKTVTAGVQQLDWVWPQQFGGRDGSRGWGGGAGVASGDVPRGETCGDATAAGVALSGDSILACRGGFCNGQRHQRRGEVRVEGSPDDRDTG
ncbi:MAG: hypothetical protein FRX49_03098 [Trebouxia sp. A1-2]|nr:MAG: hypothetical protein FRX49_03098 [Trebouxia sp. A1-2]